MRTVARGVLLWVLLLGSAMGLEAQSDLPPAQVTGLSPVEACLRWLDALEGGMESAHLRVEAALQLAGPAVIAPLARRLDERSGEERAGAAAWALGLPASVRRGPASNWSSNDQGAPWRSQATEALLRSMEQGTRGTRLLAASSLGALGAREGALPIACFLHDPELPRALEPVLLLALAGCGEPMDAELLDYLHAGGGPEWASAVNGIFLRHGRGSWGLLVTALAESDDVSVRAAAATTLLLLAEPDSACGLIECYGREPRRNLQRLILQAVAATHHPLARDFLAHVSVGDSQPDLASVARYLLEGLDEPRPERRPDPLGIRRSVPVLLQSLAIEPGFTSQLEDVLARAEAWHVPLLTEVLKRLPLRDDERWPEDHAQLAQLRARLLCLDGVDCLAH